MKTKTIILGLTFFLSLTLASCGGKKKSKGFDYQQHKQNNSEMMRDARKRNKKSNDLINHKGKSVKRPKSDMP
jgi:hypothetical protein